MTHNLPVTVLLLLPAKPLTLIPVTQSQCGTAQYPALTHAPNHIGRPPRRRLSAPADTVTTSPSDITLSPCRHRLYASHARGCQASTTMALSSVPFNITPVHHVSGPGGTRRLKMGRSPLAFCASSHYATPCQYAPLISRARVPCPATARRQQRHHLDRTAARTQASPIFLSAQTRPRLLA